MEKKLPEFKPLPELGNVSSNYMSAFNVGMNIYEALTYLQGYVQVTYSSQKEIVDDWNNLETWIQENLITAANEKTQEILQGWLDDGTIHDILVQKATSDILGTIKLGKTYENGRFPLLLDENDRAYVDASNIMGADYKEGHYPLSFDENYKAKVDLNSSNPNLLDNADFKSGIINQRGKEEYNYGVTTGATGNKDTIDRWISNCTKVSVENGKIHIEYDNSTAYSYLQQKLSSVCDGDYTLYVKVSNVTEGSMFIAFDGNQSDKLDISDDGEYVHTFKNVNNQDLLVLFVGTGFKGDIECIKLEKGSVFTGMPQWNETDELLKCKRYLRIYDRYPMFFTTQHVVTGFVPISFDPPMHKIPSISATEVLNSSASPVSRQITQATVTKNNMTNIRLDSALGDTAGYISLICDAEMY